MGQHSECWMSIPKLNYLLLWPRRYDMLVDLDRKHAKVSKTVKIVSEYNRTNLTDENLRNVHSGSSYFCSFLFNAITVSIDLGLKLQFLCLPLYVNSL
jgi:hypothetical protein